MRGPSVLYGSLRLSAASEGRSIDSATVEWRRRRGRSGCSSFHWRHRETGRGGAGRGIPQRTKTCTLLAFERRRVLKRLRRLTRYCPRGQCHLDPCPNPRPRSNIDVGNQRYSETGSPMSFHSSEQVIHLRTSQYLRSRIDAILPSAQHTSWRHGRIAARNQHPRVLGHCEGEISNGRKTLRLNRGQ